MLPPMLRSTEARMSATADYKYDVATQAKVITTSSVPVSWDCVP
jgi:hypothetical protein